MIDDLHTKLREAAQKLDEGRALDSERICLDLLSLHPLNADIRHVLALSYRAQGRSSEAERELSRALSRSSKNPSIFNSYGLILLDQGKLEAAQKMFVKAINLDKSMAAAHTNLGHAQSKLGQQRMAEKSYREALRLNTTLPDALIHLALLLRNEGRLSSFNFPPDLLSETPAAHPGLAMVQGLIALDKGKPEQAETLFRHALNMQSNSAPLWSNLGLSLAKQGKKEAAHEAYTRATDLDPALFEAKVNLADLWKYDSPSIARSHLLEAIILKPEDKAAQDMLGFTWFMDGDMDAALVCFQRALDIDPTYDQAAAHKAGAHFLKEEFSEAWKEYNRKYGPTGLSGSPIKERIPLWDQNLTLNKPILVWTDQGLGDEIMQLGLVADVYERGIPLILATSERLVPIVERSFPGAMCISKNSLTHQADVIYLPSAQSPAIRLAQILRKSIDDFPDRKAYLKSDNSQTTALRKKYLGGKHGNKPLIGLSWRSANAAFGSHKSIALKEFLPLLNITECLFVNLQYGETEQDLSELPIDIRQNLITDMDIDPLKNMDDFASQVAALDLIITTSNTTAHMAAALGRPTWTLIPRKGPGWLWYWFEESSKCPWYPSMRIHRQAKNASWQAALATIATELTSFIKEFQSLTRN